MMMMMYVYDRETVPFISTTAHSKLLFRAVHLDDNKMLKQLIDNTQQVAKVRVYALLSYSPRRSNFTNWLCAARFRAVRSFVTFVY